MNHDRLLPTRRQLLRTGAAGFLSTAMPERLLLAQPKAPSTEIAPLNRFPRVVQEWYVEQVRAAERVGIAARAKLKTKADAEAYIRAVREKIARCFGPFPEKTPLNGTVTGNGRSRRLHHREGDLREPAALPRNGQSLPAQEREGAAAGSGRHLRPLRRREDGTGIPVVRAGPGANGIRGPDLSTPSARASGSSTATSRSERGRAWESANTSSRAISSSWSASSSARGGPGTAFAPSITCCRGRRSIRSTSASPATRAAGR